MRSIERGRALRGFHASAGSLPNRALFRARMRHALLSEVLAHAKKRPEPPMIKMEKKRGSISPDARLRSSS